MPTIEEIKITDGSGFFTKKNFEWTGIKPFSIITGINGSGKTKLLEYIDGSSVLTENHLIRYIETNYKPPLEKHANELESKYTYKFNQIGDIYEVLQKADTSTRESWSNNKSAIKKNVIKHIDYMILDGIIKQRIKFNQDSTKQREELDRVDKYQELYDMSVLLPSDPTKDQPWDRIDRILNNFEIKVRIDRSNLNAQLRFLRLNTEEKTEIGVELNELSSGEKVAFSLALWTWGNAEGQKTEVLLVDEFDAHLNPSISQKFIQIIKTYFVEMGVQVIMTTHNPSTVSFAKELGASIIWMEDGRVSPKMDYENIIHTLSNGLIDIYNLLDETQLLIGNREKTVIYTEGKTDKKHIESAIKALNFEEKFENYFVFACTSASTVPFFISLPTGQSKRIALLDSDKAGKSAETEINKRNTKKIEEGKYKITFVSDEENKVIEDLFSLEIRNDGAENKSNFADYMARPENLTKANFLGFKPLLEKILS